MPSATLTDDAYHSLAELFGLLGAVRRVKDGFLYALTNGATWLYGNETTPTTATAGGPIATGAGVVLGTGKPPGWRLDRIWVRNTTAGSNATLQLSANELPEGP